MELEKIYGNKEMDDFLKLNGDGKKLYDQALGHIYSKLGCKWQAEDVLSEVRIKLIETEERYDTKKPFRNWLYACINNKIADQFRGNNLRYRRYGRLDEEFIEEKHSVSDIESFDHLDEVENDYATVAEALNILPYEERRIIQLVYFEGKKYQEGANDMGIPIGTFKSKSNKAMNSVKEYIRKKERKSAA